MSPKFPFPFGRPGDERFSFYQRRRRSPTAFDKAAISVLDETWATGDRNQRHQLLNYLFVVRPREGLEIAWQGLRDDDTLLRAAAAMALMRYVQEGASLNEPQMEVLAAAARSPNQSHTKSLLLLTLEPAGYRRFDQLLHDLQSDDSPDVRFDANIRLLKRGRDTKQRLFADLDQLLLVDHAASQLWADRDFLRLSKAEEQSLRGRIEAELERRRTVCRTRPQPYNTALFIFMKLKDGFPAAPDDIDFMGEAVSHALYLHERLDAVRAVAWFGNERARIWLERLGQEPYQPAVRREARRQLRLLTARSARR